jgi:hypothetical protein
VVGGEVFSEYSTFRGIDSSLIVGAMRAVECEPRISSANAFLNLPEMRCLGCLENHKVSCSSIHPIISFQS